MSNSHVFTEQKFVDYIVIDHEKVTPDQLDGRFTALRKDYFEREFIAAPIIPPSRNMSERELNRMSATERYQRDMSDYSFEGGRNADNRFLTEFDYYAALIRAAEDNADAVYTLKRNITRLSHIVDAQYSDIYNRCLSEEGRTNMGSNAEERRAWFNVTYPALTKIKMMYDDFIEEIDIELQRLDAFSKAASRSLSALELGYQATGRLYNNKSGKYV